jgi:hypothetical protein
MFKITPRPLPPLALRGWLPYSVMVWARTQHARHERDIFSNQRQHE